MRNAVAFRFSQDIGRLAENFVFLELERRGYEVFYFEKKQEVDFYPFSDILQLQTHKKACVSTNFFLTIDFYPWYFATKVPRSWVPGLGLF